MSDQHMISPPVINDMIVPDVLVSPKSSTANVNKAEDNKIFSMDDKTEEEYHLSPIVQKENSEVLTGFILNQTSVKLGDPTILSSEDEQILQPNYSSSFQRSETSALGQSIVQPVTTDMPVQLLEDNICSDNNDNEVKSNLQNTHIYTCSEPELKEKTFPVINDKIISDYGETTADLYSSSYCKTKEQISTLPGNAPNYIESTMDFSQRSHIPMTKTLVNFQSEDKSDRCKRESLLETLSKGNNVDEVLQLVPCNISLVNDNKPGKVGVKNESTANSCASLNVKDSLKNVDSLVPFKKDADSFTHNEIVFSNYLKSQLGPNNMEILDNIECSSSHQKGNSDIFGFHRKDSKVSLDGFEPTSTVKFNLCATFESQTNASNKVLTYIISSNQQDPISILFKSWFKNLHMPESAVQIMVNNDQDVHSGKNDQLVPSISRKSADTQQTLRMVVTNNYDQGILNNHQTSEIMDRCDITSLSVKAKDNNEEENMFTKECIKVEDQKEIFSDNLNSVNVNDNSNYKHIYKNFDQLSFFDLSDSTVSNICSENSISEQENNCYKMELTQPQSYPTSRHLITVQPDTVGESKTKYILCDYEQTMDETRYSELEEKLLEKSFDNGGKIWKGVLEIESVDGEKIDNNVMAIEKEDVENENNNVETDAKNRFFDIVHSDPFEFAEKIDDIDKAIEDSIQKYEFFMVDKATLATPNTSDKSCQTVPYQRESRELCKRCLTFIDDIEPSKKIRLTYENDTEADVSYCNNALKDYPGIVASKVDDRKENKEMKLGNDRELISLEDSNLMNFDDGLSELSLKTLETASALKLGDIYTDFRTSQANEDLSLYEEERIEHDRPSVICEENRNNICKNQEVPFLRVGMETESVTDSPPNPTPPKLRVGLSRTARLKSLHPKLRYS